MIVCNLYVDFLRVAGDGGVSCHFRIAQFAGPVPPLDVGLLVQGDVAIGLRALLSLAFD